MNGQWAICLLVAAIDGTTSPPPPLPVSHLIPESLRIVGALDDPMLMPSVEAPFMLDGVATSLFFEQDFPLSPVLTRRADVPRAEARALAPESERVVLDVAFEAMTAFTCCGTVASTSPSSRPRSRLPGRSSTRAPAWPSRPAAPEHRVRGHHA